MTGETDSGLSPLFFEPDTALDFIVSMTGDEFTEVLSALMTGADLSYPEKSHQVVWNFLKSVEYPVPMISQSLVSRADFTARFSSVNGGTFTRAAASFMTIPYVWQTDTTANRRIIEPIYLTAGLYDYDGLYAKASNAGISRVDIRNEAGDVVVAITAGIDQYGSFNAEFAAGGAFEITTPGYYRLVVANEGTKNTNSSGYAIYWCMHSIRAYTI